MITTEHSLYRRTEDNLKDDHLKQGRQTDGKGKKREIENEWWGTNER